MSSTTEESDWNQSSASKRKHSLSASFDIPHQPASQANSSALTTPRANSYASTAAQLESQLSQTVAASNNALTQPQRTVPSRNILPSQNAEFSASQLQDTPEWEAARESVLSQMVTSQDLVTVSTPTPVTKVKRGGVKTGGRRGRGGRRPMVKIEEGENGITEEAATAAGVRIEIPPVRAKNKGGRPRGSKKASGLNRGGRPRKSDASTISTTPSSTRGTPKVNRGGRPRGSRAGNSAAGVLGHIARKKKRKRASDDEDSPNDTDATEEFTPLEFTNSGRRITQAKTFSPTAIETEKPAVKRRSLNTANGGVEIPPAVTAAKKRRKPGEAAVCINCGRGHSPNSNQIVFCDGCNTPWHQFCHDRPITPSVVQIEDKEWICSECETIRLERECVAGKVAPWHGMTVAEKRTYFQTLEKNELVSLLLHASALHEDLPVFKPPPPPSAPVPVIVEPQPMRATGYAPQEEEEYYEVYVEPEPLPYPKAGNGIVLPPEDDDLALLIDEDIVTYSHSWKGSHRWEGPGGMSWVNGMPNNNVLGGGGGVAIGVGA